MNFRGQSVDCPSKIIFVLLFTVSATKKLWHPNYEELDPPPGDFRYYPVVLIVMILVRLTTKYWICSLSSDNIYIYIYYNYYLSSRRSASSAETLLLEQFPVANISPHITSLYQRNLTYHCGKYYKYI